MIRPTALNVIIIGLSVIIVLFLLRQLAAKLAERNSPFGDALGAIV